MRITQPLLLGLLPAIVCANDQVPLKEKAAGWLDKAKAYVSSATPDIPNPIDAGAAKIAALKVEKVNIRNYERKLGPKPNIEEEWIIYITGGNKTCHGRCDTADLAWNESIPLLSALPSISGSKLVLATVNCEVDEILCTSWAAAVPSVFHFIFPPLAPAGQPQAKSPMHDLPVNISFAEASHFVAIPRAGGSKYLDWEEYEGAFHPVDGSLRKNGLLTYVGYILWGFGSTPSWLIMIGISFFSRQVMMRRAMARTAPNAPTTVGQPAGGVPVAAAGPASPRGGGSAKKRR